MKFVGATHAGQSRMREQIRMTLKTPLLNILFIQIMFLNYVVPLSACYC
jgi:hypothetical protein